jgi:hypothetical protein
MCPFGGGHQGFPSPKGPLTASNIHPDYHPVIFNDSSTGKAFLTHSTLTSDVTLEWKEVTGIL